MTSASAGNVGSSANPGNRLRWLVFLAVALFLIGLFASLIPRSNERLPDTLGTATSSAGSAPARTASHEVHDAPPAFKIFKEKDGIVAVIVNPAVSRSELVSLLWHFRRKVQAHRFSELGLRSADTSSGGISVYRGSKYANETWSTAGAKGDHDAAWYQWGIEGDRRKDAGEIKNAGGDSVTIFTYEDGWQLSTAEQQQLAERESLTRKMREQFARRLQAEYASVALDVSVFTHGDEAERLVFDSKAFEDRNIRVSFVGSVLPQLTKELCAAGFTTVGVRKGDIFTPTDWFSLKCH
jgi:hypothetical protein